MPLCGSCVDACSSALLFSAILGCRRTELPLIPLSEFAEPALSNLVAVGGVEKWEARSGFRFSIPQVLCHPYLWARWPVTQRRVRPDGVVVDSPPLRQHPDLFHRVKDLAVQELVPQLRVEALAVAVLPWASWFDIGR